MPTEKDIRDDIERAIWRTAGIDPQRQLRKKLNLNSSRAAYIASSVAAETRGGTLTMDMLREAQRKLENPPAHPKRVKVKSLEEFRAYLIKHNQVRMTRMGPNRFGWLGCLVTEHDHLAEGCAHISMSDDTVKIAHFHGDES